jgi:GNAT superfamily N-acetyltransferase
MGDQWMIPRTIKIAPDDLAKIPLHPNWRFEAQPDGFTALLLPRPRFGHALLSLNRWRCPGPVKEVDFRPWKSTDPKDLVPLFSQAFASLEPIAGLGMEERRAAAEEALAEAWKGTEGPVSRSSAVAIDPTGKALGAVMVTLLPGGNLDGPGAWRWYEPAPLDLEAMGGGLPHLTWIFVDPDIQHSGLGASLLSHTIAALRPMGYSQLASTFLTGNHASALWHWRMGFELMSWPGSPRWR